MEVKRTILRVKKREKKNQYHSTKNKSIVVAYVGVPIGQCGISDADAVAAAAAAAAASTSFARR